MFYVKRGGLIKVDVRLEFLSPLHPLWLRAVSEGLGSGEST